MTEDIDKYVEETPEEREAGRKLMRNVVSLIEQVYAAETEEEAEAIIAEFDERMKNDG